MKRGFVIAALAIGLGLAAAPAVFQMFTRAPKGGRMIKAFQPYMTHANTAKFQGYMAEIDRADRESQAQLPALLSSRAGIAPGGIASRFPSLAAFNTQWPQIHADMSDDMLVKMDRMVPNYRAVKALPPFVLFPWFFVIPGLFVAGFAGWALRADGAGRSPRAPLTVLAVFGVAIIAAPAVFQMFTRAPKGATMIKTFKPLMTTRKVTTIQGYFLVIGSGEGEVRNQVDSVLLQHGVGPQQLSSALPALAAFHRDWPRISSDMAPMIGAMSDNVTNYEAVKALPPFWLFPWFFVLPGLLIAGLAVAARPRPGAEPAVVAVPADDRPTRSGEPSAAGAGRASWSGS
jgi:hypothetical protein